MKYIFLVLFSLMFGTVSAAVPYQSYSNFVFIPNDSVVVGPLGQNYFWIQSMSNAYFGEWDGETNFNTPLSGGFISTANSDGTFNFGKVEHYTNDGSWHLEGVYDYNGEFQEWVTLWAQYKVWRDANAQPYNQTTFCAFLDGYVPPPPCVPVTYGEFPWPVKPGDENIDGNWDTIQDTAGIPSPISDKLDAASISESMYVVAYANSNDNAGFVLATIDPHTGRAQLYWYYADCEASEFSLIGTMAYGSVDDGFTYNPVGDFQYNDEPEDPPQSSAPSEDGPGPVDAPGYDETPTSEILDELIRLNHNVNAQTDVMEDGFNKVLESDVETREVLRSMSEDAAEFQERSEAKQDESLQLDRDRNATLNRMDAKLQTLINQNAEGQKIDGEIGEVAEVGDPIPSEMYGDFTSAIDDKFGSYDPNFSGSVPANFSVPLPVIGTVDVPLTTEGSGDLVEAADGIRLLIRCILAVSAFYLFWLSCLKLIKV